MKNNKQYTLAAIIMVLSTTAAMAADEAVAKGENVQELANLMQWIFLGLIGIVVAIVGITAMRTMKIYQDMLSSFHKK